MKDLSFLEHKDGDSETMRSLKSYWQMVMDMPEPERKVFLQEERVREEERYLQWMINCNKKDDETVADFTRRARSLVIDYRELGDEEAIKTAEAYTEFSHGIKAGKFTIKDIRKQREKIQCERSKLKKMQQHDEPSHYSSNSKT